MICSSICHAIPPCSITSDEDDEGYGAQVTCSHCLLNENYSEQNDDENHLENDEGPSQAKKCRRSFTTKKKIEIIEFAHKHSNHKAESKFGVDRHCIISWKKQEKQLRLCLQTGSKSHPKKRLPGGGRHLADKNFDDELSNWIKQQRAEKQRITRRIIQQQALTMIQKTEEEGDELEFKVLDYKHFLVSTF
jgi:hypothetical protein